MATPAPYRLHASLGYQLTLAARVQERRLDQGLRDLGLSRITWCILLAVGNEAKTQPSEIARFVGIDRTATSRALRQMEAAGLISRTSGTSDRRTTSVSLTMDGKKRLQLGTPFAVENNTMMELRLSPAEQTDLFRLLQKVREGDQVELPGI